MFLKSKSFSIFDELSDVKSGWNYWNSTGRQAYFKGELPETKRVLDEFVSRSGYLDLYPDVKDAGKRKGTEWGFKHLIQAGLYEIFCGRRQDKAGLRALGTPSAFVTRRVADGYLNLFGILCQADAKEPYCFAVQTEGQIQPVDKYDLEVVRRNTVSHHNHQSWIFGVFVSPEPILGVVVGAVNNARHFEELIVSNGLAGWEEPADEIQDAGIVPWLMRSKIATMHGATVVEFLEDLFGGNLQHQKFNAELIRIINSECLLFMGWCLDQYEPIKQIIVLANDQVTSFDPEKMLRTIRHDLLGLAGGQIDNVFEAGLCGLEKYAGSQREDATALVMVVSDSLVSWALFPINYSSGPVRMVMREALSILPYPGPTAFARFIKGGAGTVLGELLAKAPPELAAYRIECFGQMPADPVASIVIPLYGRMDFIKHQLAAFSEDEDFRNVDLIYVVDDPKNAEQARHFAYLGADIHEVPFRVVYLKKNLGYGGANNAGAQVAIGKEMIFLNSDVIPLKPGWIRQLVEPLANSDVGIVGARLLYHDGTLQHDGLGYSTKAYLAVDGMPSGVHKLKGIMPSRVMTDVVSDVAAVTGACLAIRKSDFEKIGGFSKDYLVGDYEDSDLCMKMRSLHKRIVIDRCCVLYHLERQSIPFDPLSIKTSILNMFTHMSKWGPELETLVSTN